MLFYLHLLRGQISPRRPSHHSTIASLGQGHRKDATLPNLAFDGKGAILSFNQRLGNSHPQAGARLGPSCLATIKALENVGQHLGLNVGASIVDAYGYGQLSPAR